MKEIPFFNYSKLYCENADEYNRIFSNTCSKGSFIMQEELSSFEDSLANFLGCKYAFGVADGTAALMFSLKSSGISPGDEVIVSSHTFIATAAAIHHIGAIPVVCDCRKDSSFDYLSAEKLITKNTKALMPTQLNGRVSDMEQIFDLAYSYDLKIIEDSCQAIGSKYKNKFAGLFGSSGSFSFYPAKTLGCFGDGGAIVTNDDDIAKQIRELRDHGRGDNGEVLRWGHNARLDNIQAAFLNFNLSKLQERISRRRNIASIYDEMLRDKKDILLPPAPQLNSKYFDTYQNYEIQLDRRDGLRDYLKMNGVGTIVQWGGKMLHQFKKLSLKNEAPYAEKMSKRMLLLPMNHMLEDEEVKYICNLILSNKY